jgi:hypothetical protein
VHRKLRWRELLDAEGHTLATGTSTAVAFDPRGTRETKLDGYRCIDQVKGSRVRP